MKAAVLREIGKPLVIEELGLPALSEGQLLVRMQMAAVCHSQKLEVSGGRGKDLHLPHLIGHEGVGVVEEVGPGVKKVRRNDQVVLSWIRGSGLRGNAVCYSSKDGSVNAGPIATFCESPIVSEQCVTRIDPSVDPEMAVLAGCAIPTGVGTVKNAMPANPHGFVGIIGLGGVGLAAVCGAVLAGWRRIVAADLQAPRLQRALKLGATDVIHVGREKVEEAVDKITGGVGLDLVLECAGSSESMEMAVRLAKPHGGRVVIVGNLEAGRKISLDPFDLIKGRWIGGSWGGGVHPDLDIPEMVRLVERGAVNHTLLMGERFPLEQVNEAMHALGSESAGRPVLQCAPVEAA